MSWEQVNNAITGYFVFMTGDGKQGKIGLSPNVRITRGGTTILAASAGSTATEVGSTDFPGLYKYTLASGSVGTEGDYVFCAHTSDTTVQSQDVYAIWLVGHAGVEHLNEDVSAVAADILADTSAGHKIATNASGQVVASSVVGDVGGRVRGAGASSFVGVGVQADVQQWMGDEPDPLSGGILPVDVQTWLTGVPAALEGDRVQTTAPTAGDIDTQLTGSHGGESWQQGNIVAPLDATATAAAVLDALAADYDTAGTVGALIAAGATVVDLAPVLDNLDTLIGRLTALRAGYLDNLAYISANNAISVSNVVDEFGVLTLLAGVAYDQAITKPIQLGTLDSTAPDMRSTTSAVVTLHCYAPGKRVSFFDQTVTVSGPREAQVLTITNLSSEESNDLLGNTTNDGRWDAVAVYPVVVTGEAPPTWVAMRGKLIVQYQQGSNQ